MDYVIPPENETSTNGPEKNHDGLPGKSSRESTGGCKASLAKPLGTVVGGRRDAKVRVFGWKMRS